MHQSLFKRALIALVLAALAATASPATPAPLRVSDLLGEWAWSCCDGTYSGRFQITGAKPDGTFSGRFMQTNATDIGTIQGVLRGDRVSFVRTVTYQGASYEQTWKARVVFTDGTWHMVDGFWNG